MYISLTKQILKYSNLSRPDIIILILRANNKFNFYLTRLERSPYNSLSPITQSVDTDHGVPVHYKKYTECKEKYLGKDLCTRKT